jgi:hypothetical protein
VWIVHKSVNVPGYSRITSTKCPSPCMTIFSVSFANRKFLLPLSHNCSSYINADDYWHRHRSDCRSTLTYTHTNSRTFMTCDIRIGSLKLPAPEARDFVGIRLQYLDCLGRWRTGVTLQNIPLLYCYLISLTYSSVTSCASNYSR